MQIAEVPGVLKGEDGALRRLPAFCNHRSPSRAELSPVPGIGFANDVVARQPNMTFY